MVLDSVRSLKDSVSGSQKKYGPVMSCFETKGRKLEGNCAEPTQVKLALAHLDAIVSE
jgi:hypothetical protein